MAQLQQLQISFGSTEEKAVELSNTRIGALIAAIGTNRTNSEIKVTQDRTTGTSLLSGWVKAQDGQTVSESNAYVLKKSGVSVSGDLEAEEYSLLTDGTTTLYENKQMLISCINADGVSVAMQSMVTWIYLDFNYRIRESALITDEDIRQQFNVKDWVDLGNNKYRGTLIDTTGVIKISPATKDYSWSIPVEVRAYPASIDDNPGMTDTIRENRLTESVSFNAQAISVNTATIVCNSNNIKVGDQLIFNVLLGPTNNTKLEANPTYTADITCQDLTDMGNYFIVPEGLTNFTMMANITYMGRQFAVTQSFAVEHTILSKTMNPTVWAAVYAGLKAADVANETTRWTDLTEDSEFGTGDAMRVNESEFLTIMHQMDSITTSYTFDEGVYFGGFDTLHIETQGTHWSIMPRCTSLTLSTNLKKIYCDSHSSASSYYNYFTTLVSFTANGVEEISAYDFTGGTGARRLNLFYNSSKIKNVSMNSLKKVCSTGDMCLFRQSTGLNEIYLPSLEEVNTDSANYMLLNCTSLKTLSLPKLKKIGGFKGSTCGNDSLLYSCTSLETVDLSSLNEISVKNNIDTFHGCSKIKEINLPSLEKISYSSAGAMTMCYGCTLLEKFTAKKLSSVTTSSYAIWNGWFTNCHNLNYVELGTEATELVLNNLYSGGVSSAQYGMFYNAGQNVEDIKIYLNNLAKVNPMYMFYNCYWLFSDTKLLDWGGTKITELQAQGSNGQPEHYMLKGNKTIVKFVLPGTVNKSAMGNDMFGESKVVVLDIRNALNLNNAYLTFEDTRDKMLFYRLSAALPPTITAFSQNNTMPIFIGQTSSSKTLVDNIMSRYFAATNWSSLYNQLGYNEMMADYNAWLADKSVECVWEKGGDTQYAGLTANSPYYKWEDGSYHEERENTCVLASFNDSGEIFIFGRTTNAYGVSFPAVYKDNAIFYPKELEKFFGVEFSIRENDDETISLITTTDTNIYNGPRKGYLFRIQPGGPSIANVDDDYCANTVVDGYIYGSKCERYIVPSGLNAINSANKTSLCYKLCKSYICEDFVSGFAILYRTANNVYKMLGTNTDGTELATFTVSRNSDGSFSQPTDGNILWDITGTTDKFIIKSKSSDKFLHIEGQNVLLSDTSQSWTRIDERSVYVSGQGYLGYNSSTDSFSRWEAGNTNIYVRPIIISCADTTRTYPTTSQVHASNVNSNRIFPQYMKEFMCKSVLGKTYERYRSDMAIKKDGKTDPYSLLQFGHTISPNTSIYKNYMCVMDALTMKSGESIRFSNSNKVQTNNVFMVEYWVEKDGAITKNSVPSGTKYDFSYSAADECKLYVVFIRWGTSAWEKCYPADVIEKIDISYTGSSLTEYDYEDITPELLEDYGLTIEDE